MFTQAQISRHCFLFCLNLRENLRNLRETFHKEILWAFIRIFILFNHTKVLLFNGITNNPYS